MNIRAAFFEDIEIIHKIETLCFPVQEAATKKQLTERLQHFDHCFWVLETENGVIGFINGMATDQPDLQDVMYENAALHQKDGAWQMIFGLDVLPEYQRRGYASMLLHHFIQYSEQTGKIGMVLTCKQELLAFYQKFGFQNEGVSSSEHGGAVWFQMRLVF